MDTKKNYGRFSIYFNISDTRHISAIEILKSKGRKKAQYLTDAILFYDSMISGRYKENYINSYIENEIKQQDHISKDNSDSLTNDAANAIIGSLGAFKTDN